MKILRPLVFALIVSIAIPAKAATITSAQDGPWRQDSTWVGGSVPGSSDTATIVHTVTVDANLTYSGLVAVNSGGTLVVPAGVTFTFDGQPTVTKCSVASGGEVSIYGKVITGDNAVNGTDNTALFATESGSMFTMRGASLGSGFIDGIPLESSTADSTRLTVRFGERVPVEATHLRLTTGRFAGAIYPIAYGQGSRSVALAYALTQGYKVTNLISNATAGHDSLLAFDASDQPDDIYTVGSAVLQEVDDSSDTQFVAYIEKVFPSSVANYTAFFVDELDKWQDVTGGYGQYILTRGVVPNQEVEFLRMAEVFGATTKPTTDDTNRGDYTAGGGDITYLQINGDLDIDYGSVRWMGRAPASESQQSAPIYSTTAGDGDWDIDYLLLSECLQQTGILHAHAAGNTITIDKAFCFDALGPDNGNFGHFITITDGDSGATVTVTNTGAWNLKDDFMFANDGGDVVVDNSFAVVGLSANFFDWGNGAGSLSITNCEAWGLGENPIQLDDGDFTSITITDNLMVNCGLSAGRNTIDGHDLPGNEPSNNQGWGLVGAAVTCSGDITLARDTIRWAGMQVASFSPSYANTDTLFVVDWSIENYAAYTDAVPDSSSWVDASFAPGGIKANANAGGIVFVGVKFKDPWRRGWAPSGFNARANAGVQIRGGSSGQYVELRGCVFAAEQTLAEGFNPGSYYWIYSEDVDWTGGGIGNTHFDKVENALKINTNPPRDVLIYNTTFVSSSASGSEAVRIHNRDATFSSGATFVRCGFLASSGNTTRMVFVQDSTFESRATFLDCIFDDPTGAASPIVYFASADAAGLSSDSDGNMSTQGASGGDIASVAGVGQTITEMESTYGWANTVDATARYVVLPGFW